MCDTRKVLFFAPKLYSQENLVQLRLKPYTQATIQEPDIYFSLFL